MSRTAHHKRPTRIRTGEELRQRIARLERAGRRACPACGFPLYSSSSMHPQCAITRHEQEVP
jgi:hypothetical protein